MKNQFQDVRSPSLPQQLRPSTPGQSTPPGPAEAAALLAKAARLLRGIDEHALLETASGRGYTAAEHDAGWALYRAATGNGEAERVTRTPAPVRAAENSPEYRELAALGEQWFLRTRAILRRVVPLARRDAFEAELFAGLSVEGDAADLSRSLRAYLDRVDALPTHGTPGARTLATMLRARGLHEDFVAETRARLDVLDLKSLGGRAPAIELPAGAADREGAVASLAAWYRAWAGALRGGLDARQCALLGLAD